jgi:hypothetical protein
MVVLGKELREMSSMTETNSVNITSLISLIKSQNKSLQTLQRQVSILKDRIPEESDSDTDVEESKREIFCDLCDEKHLAVYHCNDCSENLCEAGASFHKKGKATKGHIVKALCDMKNIPKYIDEPKGVLMEFVDKYKIGSGGHRVCTGPNNEMITLNCGDVCVYNRKGDLLRKFGSRQLQPGQQPDYSKDLISPSRLGVSKDGDILIQDGWQNPHGGPYQSHIKVYGLNGQFKHMIDSSHSPKLTSTGNIISFFGSVERNTGQFKSNCYDEDGLQFSDPSYCAVSENGDVYTHRSIFIYVFNSSGKYLRKFNNFGESRIPESSNTTGIFICKNEVENLYVVLGNNLICVLSMEGEFLYNFTPVNKTTQNFDVLNISQFHSGEVCLNSSTEVQIFRRGRLYIQKSLTRSYNLVPKYECNQSMKSLETKNVLSVTFPLIIPVIQHSQVGISRPGMFTHTLYFHSLTSVKNAIFTVEEYFREKVTKGDFEHLSLLLSLDQTYMKYLNVYSYNWAKCKKEKCVRGYFLGGNVLSCLEMKSETELVLDITQH